jgi:S-adenosylmethionine hydrolase
VTDAAFRATGLLTLTTDFGLSDPFVGIIKGRILSRLPSASLVDLTHNLPPHRPDLAGFWLARSWPEFPPGTVHLAVVDPGVGTGRAVLMARCGAHCLLAPDNGLLAEALRGQSADFRRMAPDVGDHVTRGRLSRTFHGRDLFAPLAAELAAGRLDPEEFGPPAEPADPLPLPRPATGSGGIDGRILVADRFGNLITNINAEALATMAQPVVEAGGRQIDLCRTYGDADPGAALAVLNAFDLLELAVNGGRADRALGLAPGDPVRVRDGIST